MNPTLWRVAAYSGPGFPRPATSRIGLSSTVAQPKNPKSKIEDGLLLLLLFFWSLFFSGWSSSSSFALFLLFGDHFRSGSCRFGLRHNRLFFNYGRDDRKRCEIRLHFCRDTGRKLNVATVNGIADVQLRDVHNDPIWQIGRQTFNRQRTQALLKQSPKGFDANCRARWFERNFSLNHLVHGDRVNIDMTNLTTDGGVLHLLHERGATGSFAGNLQFN